MEQLDQKGVSKEKAKNDPLVKSLKSKIRQTNMRIAVFDKFVTRTQELAQAKAQKLAESANKEEKSEPAHDAKQAEPKSKKKAALADKESKQQPAAADETTPKKAKKQPADADEAAPKKKASKKKEE
ncbi:MAG TPA: hypothetical protein VMU29_04445 [Smithella sp.]|nr:hypothetical protein [Smithella sp.]